MKLSPHFRNDDVAVDSDTAKLAEFCAVFHELGHRVLHGVTLYGLCNYAHMHDGQYTEYPGYPALSSLNNATIEHLSKGHAFANNAMLRDYLCQSPDEIALHGLYHTHHAGMTFDEQHAGMRCGLALLHEFFPQKPIRYFIPPFNEYNYATFQAAHALGMQVLTDEGVHLEEELGDLVLEPGIWYRFHHHRFYPESCFNTLNLSIERLRQSLTTATSGKAKGYLPTPSHNLEVDMALLQSRCEAHQAQQWFYATARDRQYRTELAAALGWVVAHMPREAKVFEVGCGSANNLIWLAQHGFINLAGSDLDPKAVAVARDMIHSVSAPVQMHGGSFLELSHVPEDRDVLLAMNCTYLLPEFSLATFLRDGATRLSATGCIVMDQIDASFNMKPGNQYKSYDAHLPETERRPSEYVHRPHINQVHDMAAAAGLQIARAIPVMGTIPRVVYIFARQKTYYTPRHALSPAQRALRDRHEDMRAVLETDLFDWAWYREQYVRGPEILDPLEHYVRWGASKGYVPFAGFDSEKICPQETPYALIQKIHRRRRRG